jgi:predicted ABC-type ATPase
VSLPRAKVPPGEFSAITWAVAADQAGVTSETIVEGLSTNEKQKIESALEGVKGVPATSQTHKKGHEYTPERLRLHGKIFAELLSEDKVRAATPAKGVAPVFVMLGGRGGSGKSWFRGTVYAPSRCIVVDADEIKKMLPEYKGSNAAVVHEESSDLVAAILEVCAMKGLNVALDATLKTAHTAVERATKFKKKGFRLEVHYMHLPRQKAAQRAVKRFCGQDNGRYVHIDVILENTTNEATFEQVRKMADAWTFWDNDVAEGEPPTFVSGEGDQKLK